MAIEGPLRELGIHDVFQLLDLSRKTGTLRITSPERNNEGSVYFDAGTIVAATMKTMVSNRIGLPRAARAVKAPSALNSPSSSQS